MVFQQSQTQPFAEPTSALDQDSVRKAERVLKESGAGLIWVTHDDTQPLRVGGRVLSLPLGTDVQPREATSISLPFNACY